jgi:hypothetical protein
MYVLIGPPLPLSFDRTDLATGGHNVGGPRTSSGPNRRSDRGYRVGASSRISAAAFSASSRRPCDAKLCAMIRQVSA